MKVAASRIDASLIAAARVQALREAADILIKVAKDQSIPNDEKMSDAYDAILAKTDESTNPSIDPGSAVDAPLHSVAIDRLVEEVRNAGAETPRSYNRIYNRHNRS